MSNAAKYLDDYDLTDYMERESKYLEDSGSPWLVQVGGNHYKQFQIQPAAYCYHNKFNNLQSEIISYVSRYPLKWKDNIDKQIEDLEKAKHTIDLLLELIKADEKSR